MSFKTREIFLTYQKKSNKKRQKRRLRPPVGFYLNFKKFGKLFLDKEKNGNENIIGIGFSGRN